MTVPQSPDRPAGGSKAARAARAERVEQLRQAERARERRRTLLIAGVAAVVVLVITGLVAGSIIVEQRNKPDLGAVVSRTEARDHVEGSVTYDTTPPMGGKHNAVWLNCGVYDKPVPNENAVHSLEHGAVWITYRPDLPADQVAKLREEAPSTYMVVSPYEGLPSPVVVSAWGKQLRLTGADDKRLPAFIKEYRMSPKAPEPGAACTGGTDGSGSGGAGM